LTVENLPTPSAIQSILRAAFASPTERFLMQVERSAEREIATGTSPARRRHAFGLLDKVAAVRQAVDFNARDGALIALGQALDRTSRVVSGARGGAPRGLRKRTASKDGKGSRPVRIVGDLIAEYAEIKNKNPHLSDSECMRRAGKKFEYGRSRAIALITGSRTIRPTN
jgi:hypothetical protein